MPKVALSNHPLYCTYLGMRRRCLNAASSGYKHYGGRGIGICQRWLNSFSDFGADVGARPSNAHELDRYPNNNGDYEPGNVRWATRSEQMRNTRSNALITANNKTQTVADWMEETGLTRAVFWGRRRLGWSDEEIVNTPYIPKGGDEKRYGKRVQGDKTHCRAGHPYDKENTLHVAGERRCRICVAQNTQNYLTRKRLRTWRSSTITKWRRWMLLVMQSGPSRQRTRTHG
jgi:hypothetical protein